MKKLLITLGLLLVLVGTSHAQTPAIQRTFAMTSAATTTNGTMMVSTGASYHTFTWFTTGTVSAGACRLESSVDQTFASPVQVIAAVTVTSSGGPTALTAANANWIRFSCTTPISGTGTVTFNYYGYTTAGASATISGALPAGTNAIGTVSETATTLKRYISAGSTEDESEVKATAGVLVSISARNSNASAKAHLKCTNLTAANTTPGTSTIFYEMIIPAASGFVDSDINATFSVALTCYLVLGAPDNAVDEVAASEVSYNLRYR